MKVNIQYTIDPTQDVFLQILKNKGLSLEWIEANESDLLNGKDLYNYEKGKNLLLKHIENKSKIGILVDNDYDGIASASMIYQWLKDIDSTLELIPILTEGKVHGIIESTIPNINFLIIPDASSSEIDKHKNLANQGIDILILDHHDITTVVDENYKNAIIINPKNPLCQYENKSLSGAGVTWKFMETIDKEFNRSFYKKYTDLAASALIADVMSLKSFENKAIVNLGLNNIQNPYLQAYLKADKRIEDKEMNPILISFYFAPQINALIRMGGIEDKLELFQAMAGEIPSEPVVAKLIKTKGQQDRKKDTILPRIVLSLQKENRDNNKVIIGNAPPTLPNSMTGLVAGMLANLYQKPVMLGREKDGNLVGSIRSINDSNIENFKDFCEESKLFNWVAGHQAACGFSIPIENVEKFIEYSNEVLPPFERIFNADFQLFNNREELIIAATKLENHIGCDIQSIRLYDEIDVQPNEFQFIGKKNDTLKIVKDDVTYIQFRSKFEIPDKPCTLRIIGTPNLNEWAGTITPQIFIEEMECIELKL